MTTVNEDMVGVEMVEMVEMTEGEGMAEMVVDIVSSPFAKVPLRPYISRINKAN